MLLYYHSKDFCVLCSWISHTQIMYVKYNTQIVWFLTQDVCYISHKIYVVWA